MFDSVSLGSGFGFGSRSSHLSCSSHVSCLGRGEKIEAKLTRFLIENPNASSVENAENLTHNEIEKPGDLFH